MLICQSDDLSAKDGDLVDALVENVALRCGCGFREDCITDRVFQCFPSSPQSVTYHAQLHGTLNANVTELFTAIEEWISSGLTIRVQFLPLTLSRVCVVSSSFPPEPCPDELTTDPPTQFEDITSEEQFNSSFPSEATSSVILNETSEVPSVTSPDVTSEESSSEATTSASGTLK